MPKQIPFYNSSIRACSVHLCCPNHILSSLDNLLFCKCVIRWFANVFLFIPFIQDDSASNSLEDTSMFNVTPDGHILQVCGGHRTCF